MEWNGWPRLDRLEKRQVGRCDEQLDGSRNSGCAPYELGAFKLQDHLVHGGWCHPEEGLHVRLGGRSPVERGVGVDERQILSLFMCAIYRQLIANDAIL